MTVEDNRSKRQQQHEDTSHLRDLECFKFVMYCTGSKYYSMCVCARYMVCVYIYMNII